MVRKSWYIILILILLAAFLLGCPKKVGIPSIEAPPVEDPVTKLLEALSPAETLQAAASIRLEMVRKGQEIKYVLNGTVLYQRPDQLRIVGYLPFPFGVEVFDVLYRSGDFVLFSPLQNKAYTGDISDFRDPIARAKVKISTEKSEGNDVPERIRLEIPDKQIRVEVKLKEISLNQPLAEDAFQWIAPEGVDVQPLSEFLKGKKLE